jgi:hypothetical protein
MDDTTHLLDAYLLTGKDGSDTEQVYTKLNMSSVIGIPALVTGVVDTTTAFDNLWVFAVNNISPTDIYYSNSSNGGRFWNDTVLFEDNAGAVEVKVMSAGYNPETCQAMIAWLGGSSSPWNVSAKTVTLNSNCPPLKTLKTTSESDWDGGSFNGTTTNSSGKLYLYHHNASWTENILGNDKLLAVWHFENNSALGENDSTFVSSIGGWTATSQTADTHFNNTAGKTKIGGYLENIATAGDSNDWAEVPNDKGWHTEGGNFTYTIWARVDTVEGTMGLIGGMNGVESSTGNWIIVDNSGTENINFRIKHGDGSINPTATYSWSDGNWYHFALRYNGTFGDLFVNGKKRLSQSFVGNTPINDVEPLKIGSARGGSTNDFGEGIDEFAIWNRSLSDSEISKLFDAQRDLYPANGTYESKVFDAGETATWGNITIHNETTDSNVTWNITVRSCDDSACDGESYTYFDIVGGQTIDLSVDDTQYFQYMLSLVTENRNKTPAIDNVLIEWNVPADANVRPEIPDLIFPVAGTAMGSDGNNTFNFSSSDNNSDSITFNVYINDTLNVTGTSTNVTGWEAGDGNYVIKVDAHDDSLASTGNSTAITFDFVNVADSCGCPGAGDWVVNCTDGCTITSDCMIPNSNLILTNNTGVFTVEAIITVADYVIRGDERLCKIFYPDGGGGRIVAR